MLSHKLYTKIINNISYKYFVYNNNPKDDKYINQLVNKYDNIIIKLLINSVWVSDNFHPYYNPGVNLYKITYYKNGEIIFEYEQTYGDYKKQSLRLLKINKIKEKINERLLRS